MRQPWIASDDDSAGGLSRRKLLVAAGQGALALGVGGLVAGCADSAGTATTSGGQVSAGGGKPVRGGTLTAGITGAGSFEQLYPGTISSFPDVFRIQQLYDNLFNVSADDSLSLEPALALSAESNADATVWTFKLRDGVHWHDGKPFTADDVLYTFKVAWASPTNFANSNVAAFVDFKRLRKRDRLTVEVPLIRPCAQFPTLFTFDSGATWIVPDGSDPRELARRPNGTGPFKFESFDPGKQSVFTANRDYWETGKPYVDRLVVNSSFASDTSLVNALLSGQIDVLTPLPYSQARRYENSSQMQVLRAPGRGGSFLYMRVDEGPFADPRVRQAMKLAIDREQMVQSVISGYGAVGIDTNPQGSAGLEYAIDSPQPTYDPEKARALLKAAGQEGMAVTFATAPINDTFVPAATLISEGARAAGIKMRVNVLSTSTYYTDASGYAERSSVRTWRAVPPRSPLRTSRRRGPARRST